MAKPIGITPTLKGKEARDFISKMNRAPTNKDKEFKKKLDSLERVVKF